MISIRRWPTVEPACAAPADVPTDSDGEWRRREMAASGRSRAARSKAAHREAAADRNERAALPSSAFPRRLPAAEGQLPRPLSPSGAGTMIDEEADDLIDRFAALCRKRTRAGPVAGEGQVWSIACCRLLTGHRSEAERARRRRRVTRAAPRVSGRQRTRTARRPMRFGARSCWRRPSLRAGFCRAQRSRKSRSWGTLALEGRRLCRFPAASTGWR